MKVVGENGNVIELDDTVAENLLRDGVVTLPQESPRTSKTKQ